MEHSQYLGICFIPGTAERAVNEIVRAPACTELALESGTQALSNGNETLEESEKRSEEIG